MAHDVFVSYSNKDKAIADTIVASMEKNDIRCWYAPRDIKPSEDWGRAISNAIQQSKVFLLIFSGNSNQSQRVLDEVNLSISQEVTILPFRIEKLEPGGAMKLHLSSRHWLDAYDPSWESYIRQLIKAVSSNLESAIDEENILVPEEIEREGKKQKSKKLTRFLAGVVIGAIVITAGWFGFSAIKGGDNLAEVEPVPVFDTAAAAVGEEEIAGVEYRAVLDITFPVDELELDPQIYKNVESSILSENLFVNLTNYDYDNARVIPEAAESWSVSLDGKLYTFKIRQDIPWVKHSLGGETIQEVDENGNERFVTAHDFVYAIQRICNPAFEVALGFEFFPLVKGCQDVFEYEDPENIPDELFAAIGARAVSTDELLIELTEPSGYFLTMTIMNSLSAVPQWAIENYGDAWKNPGVITTNGYYLIDEIELGESIHLVRNPLFPEDLAGSGNIGEINIKLGEDLQESYQLWLEDKIDVAEIRGDEITDHKSNYPDEIYTLNIPAVHYFDLNDQMEPFDNVHVRRAFAAAFDASSFIEKVVGDSEIPMTHLGPPGVVGAPPYDEIGIGYDPSLAKNELAQGGYPNCDGFPQVDFYQSAGRFLFTEEIIRNWEDALGCPEGTINTISELDGSENLDIVYAGWGCDYPDENNIVGNVLYCKGDFGWFERDCIPIDELILQARQEISLEERASLYYQIENAFFGPEGDFTIIPGSMFVQNWAVQEWLEISNDLFGNRSYYDWIIDMDAKHGEATSN